MTNTRIRKGDKVMIITGKDAGKIGKVLKILRKHDRVLVEGANVSKRSMRPNPYTRTPGGIVDKAMPVHIPNVMVVCSACAEPTKVGYRYVEKAEGKLKKVRFCKKCNEVME